MYKILLLTAFFLSISVFGNDLTVVAIGDAEKEADEIIFIHGKSLNKDEKSFIKILENDFGFYRTLFKVKGSSSSHTSGELAQVRFVTRVGFEMEGKNKVVNISLTDSLDNNFSYDFKVAISNKNKRFNAHSVANNIYEKIIGKKSIFLSKIIFVSDKLSSRKNVIKELYQSDFDGGNVKRLTRHRGLVISPAISHDGKRVLYSLISSIKRSKKRNINLRMLNIATNKSSLISA